MTNKQTDKRGSELSPCAALLIKIFPCNLCQLCKSPLITPTPPPHPAHSHTDTHRPLAFHFRRVCMAGKLQGRTKGAALTRPNWIVCTHTHTHMHNNAHQPDRYTYKCINTLLCYSSPHISVPFHSPLRSSDWSNTAQPERSRTSICSIYSPTKAA